MIKLYLAENASAIKYEGRMEVKQIAAQVALDGWCAGTSAFEKPGSVASFARV